MQISRFTSSKPSKFAFASDEKSIRQPTTSFVRCYLKDIREHHITGYILEMSSCVNSCVGGPGMKEHSTPFLMSKDAVYTFSRKDNGGEMPPSEKVQAEPRR